MNQKMKNAAYAAAIAGAVGGILPASTDLSVMPHETVCFANAARFVESYYQQPLTDFAVGWRDPSTEATLEALAPAVLTPHRFEYAEFINAEAFYSDTDDERAIGGDFKTVDYTSTKTTAKLANRGLSIRIDLDNVGDFPNWEIDYTQRLLQRCLRNELRRAGSVASAGATNTAKTWDTSAGKDPDQDMLADLITGADLIGVRANTAIIGETAWSKRLLSHRAQATAGGFASAGKTTDELAAWLNLDRVVVSKERYASSSTAKTQIISNLVIFCVSNPGMSTEDPSNLKRFWAPCEGGSKYRVFRHEIGPKIVVLTVEYYSLIKLVSSIGLRKFTIS